MEDGVVKGIHNSGEYRHNTSEPRPYFSMKRLIFWLLVFTSVIGAFACFRLVLNSRKTIPAAVRYTSRRARRLQNPSVDAGSSRA